VWRRLSRRLRTGWKRTPSTDRLDPREEAPFPALRRWGFRTGGGSAAVAWRKLPELPCRIQLVKVDTRRKPEAYDDAQYERLVAAARQVGAEEELLILLGGDAGLRCGEMIPLEWADVAFTTGTITVQRAEYRERVGTPEGGKTRVIPMTTHLRDALKAYRHLRGSRIFYRADGTTLLRRDGARSDHPRREARGRCCEGAVPQAAAHVLLAAGDGERPDAHHPGARWA
jgi:integrase